MDKPRVLVTAYWVSPGGELDRALQGAGFETVFNPITKKRSEDEMVEILKGIDAVVAGADPYTARVLASTNRLKIIARTGVGYDSVDVKAATAAKVAVCVTAGLNRHSVSEYAFALMLYCAKRLGENAAEVQRRGWRRHEGIDLAGKTLGIIGLGTIGKEVAQRAAAFEMRLLAYELFQDQVFAEAMKVAFVPLDQLLKESDFVTLHINLSPQSHHFINAERLALMKPTAYLINTSRGGVVDTDALYQALKEKRIGGAGLDVFEQEPLGESPLLELDNVILTPHAAGSTHDTHDRSPLIAAGEVIRLFKGERPLHVLNPEVLS